MHNFQEKEMVNDILSMVNSSLTCYATYISETSNPQLRQTLQQMRNSDEQFQYQLFQVAEQKGFYQAAHTASPQDIQNVKSQVC